MIYISIVIPVFISYLFVVALQKPKSLKYVKGEVRAEMSPYSYFLSLSQP